MQSHSLSRTEKTIERPHCPVCGALMAIVSILPDKPDHDRRTFECAACSHTETMVFKFK